MPSISQTTISPISGKKRRRDDDAGGVLKISSPRHALHDTIFHNAANRDDSLHLNTERKQIAPRRRLHEQKRQRIEVADLQSRENRLHEDSYIKEAVGEIGGDGREREVKPKINLSPCHVCWRKPTEKNQLDSYAYCEGCGKRACYVCMRECEGLGGLRHTEIGVGEGAFSFEFESTVDGDMRSWQGFGGGGEVSGEGREVGSRTWERERIEGHRGRICSRCCVERGTEGEVWCLGCLRAEEGVS